MQRISCQFRMLGRLGFVVLLFCLSFAYTIHPTFAQAQVRWVTEFAPTSYLLCRAVVLTATDVVVVGGIRDDWLAEQMDGFVQALDLQTGEETSYSRHAYGEGTIFYDAVTIGQDSIVACGGMTTFDGLYSHGLTARMAPSGETTWSHQTSQLEADESKTIMLTADSTLVMSVEWRDLGHVGQQIYFVHMSLDGEMLDSVRSPYVYGEFINIWGAATNASMQHVFVGEIWRWREPLLEKSLYVYATTAAFDTLWTHTITLQDTELIATSVDFDDNGNILIGGIAGTWPTEVRVLKYTSDGELLWQRSYDHGNPGPTGIMLQCVNDKIVIGSTYYDWGLVSPYLVILDSQGDVQWDSILTTEGSSFSATNDMAISEDQRTIVLVANGDPDELQNDIHGYAICLDLGEILGTHPPQALPSPRRLELTNVYPNPTNSRVTIAFQVLRRGQVSAHLVNVLGQRVMPLFSGAYIPGKYESNVSLEGVASGQYLISLESESDRVTKKVTLIR